MKKEFNAFVNGIGYLFFAWGFIICMGAAGNSDLGADMAEVVRLTAAGMAACIGGGFLTWWRV